MKIKLLLPFFLLPPAAAAQQAQISLDSLKEAAALEIYNSEVRPMRTDNKNRKPNPLLDSAAEIALANYKAGSLYVYPTTGRGQLKTMEQLMVKHYGVKLLPRDTARSSKRYNDNYYYYYNICTRVLIKQQYGWNALQKLFIEAQKVDGSGHGTRQAGYAAGHTTMLRDVYCNLNLLDADNESLSMYFYVLLYVNAKGSLDSATILDPYEFMDENDMTDDDRRERDSLLRAQKKYRRELLKTAGRLKGFIYATEDGKPLPDTIQFEIEYSPDGKKYGCNPHLER